MAAIGTRPRRPTTMRTRSDTDSHEVDHANSPFRGFEIRFEYQRALAVTTRDRDAGIARGDFPVSMLARSEQRGEARIRIEPRPAQPVDGTAARYECRRLAIADQCTVFNRGCHGSAPCNSRSGAEPGVFGADKRQPRSTGTKICALLRLTSSATVTVLRGSIERLGARERHAVYQRAGCRRVRTPARAAAPATCSTKRPPSTCACFRSGTLKARTAAPSRVLTRFASA